MEATEKTYDELNDAAFRELEPPRSHGPARRLLYCSERSFMLLLHVSAAVALWRGASRSILALAVLSYVVRMFGISGGYHRYFSHRAFKTSRIFQVLLAVIGSTSTQRGPLWWASLHRLHHRHADTPKDIHSPSQRGFWYAHWSWWWGTRHEITNLELVKDWARFPELRFLNDYYQLVVLADVVMTYALFGIDGALWLSAVPTLLVLHGESAVNSVCHVWGRRRYATRDTSRNSVWIALLTMGEGWHNNHHHHMGSANHGFFWWEVDLTYYLIRALQAVGIVWDVRVARRLRIDDVASAPSSGAELRPANQPE